MNFREMTKLTSVLRVIVTELQTLAEKTDNWCHCGQVQIYTSYLGNSYQFIRTVDQQEYLRVEDFENANEAVVAAQLFLLKHAKIGVA